MIVQGFSMKYWPGYSDETTYIDIDFETEEAVVYWAHNQCED